MKKRYLMTLMLIIIIFTTLSFSTPVAGSDELKRELLEDIIPVDKPELFGEYRELYLAKAQTQAVIQSMEGSEVTRNTEDWVNILLGIIDVFEEITHLSKSSAPSDHIKAIETADRELNTSINTLRGYSIAEVNGIPMFAEIALMQFYRSEGEFFEDIARNEDETKVKIDHTRNSSIAYGKGDMPTEKSRMEFESRRLEWMYNRDMKRASEYITASRAHLNNAENHSSGFFGADFMEIIKARDSFEEAKKVYEKHKDKELENVKAIEGEIKGVHYRLMRDTLKFVAIYLFILAIFTAIVGRDFKKWGDARDDAMLGDELIV